MAGIHSLRDLNRDSERQRLVNQPQPQRRNIPLLGYGFSLGTPEEARKETFGQMIKYIFCPFFEVLSFIFIITVASIQIVDIILYFITVFIDYDSSSFLEPRTDVLDDFGAKEAEKMQEGQVWRWITPMLLHANLTHLVVRYIQYNMIMQLILGFRLEPTVGVWRTIVVYVGSGIGGILFACLVAPETLSVGASTAIFGLTTAMVVYK
jgi:membrane associated rhomboid family serine protease